MRAFICYPGGHIVGNVRFLGRNVDVLLKDRKGSIGDYARDKPEPGVAFIRKESSPSLYLI